MCQPSGNHSVLALADWGAWCVELDGVLSLHNGMLARLKKSPLAGVRFVCER
jgi:hypothetical protein